MMADTVILETQTLTFEEGTLFGKTAMMSELSDEDLFAAIGIPLKITWDGNEYILDGQYIAGMAAFGNLSIMDSSYPDTGEPFIIGGQLGYGVFISADMTAQTHNVGISVDFDFSTLELIQTPGNIPFSGMVEGLYAGDSNGAFAGIKANKSYLVYWDAVFFKVPGESYEIAISETENATISYVGDIGLMAVAGEVPEGTDGSGEPFCIYVVPSEVTGGAPFDAVITNSSASSHVVGLVEIAAKVVLKDRNGQPVEHAPVQKIKVKMSDGTISLWIDETSVPTPVPAEIELDLTGGNQTVTPINGQVFSSIEIIKPADLSPENILLNKNIGGVIGAYEAPEKITAEITPDFSGGNMTKVPDAGKVFDEVVVIKPETLLEENIKKNAVVAGITGSLNYIEDVATASGMDSVLIEENEGNVYRYTGTTTDIYVNGDIYIVEAGT